MADCGDIAIDVYGSRIGETHGVVMTLPSLFGSFASMRSSASALELAREFLLSSSALYHDDVLN